MKIRKFQNLLLAIAVITALAFAAGNVKAQDLSTSTSTTAPPLSYGVSQVLQLSQAKVSDGIIVQYIQNSGTIYALNAKEIVYLKSQGVSDTVLNAMLGQRRRITGSSEPNTPTSSSTAQTAAPAAAQPTVTYVQTAPAYVPSSTVYIIPDTQTSSYYSYYYHRPYYYPYVGPYFGWGYPGVSLSFGFGDGWGGHYRGGFHSGYRGGFRGGYHGGFHGGGHHR